MPNYARAKVYAIAADDDPTTVYVGLTTERYITKRLGMHRLFWRRGLLTCTSRILFDRVGAEACSVRLLEAVPCRNAVEAAEAERRWMEKMRADGYTLVNRLNRDPAGLCRRLLANTVKTFVEHRACGVEEVDMEERPTIALL